jgi:hypothetical protein
MIINKDDGISNDRLGVVGAIPMGNGQGWSVLEPVLANSVLACQPVASGGYKVGWYTYASLSSIDVPTAIFTTVSASTLNLGGGLVMYAAPNATIPATKPNFPGAAAGVDAVADAAVINAITAILVGFGMCASS